MEPLKPLFMKRGVLIMVFILVSCSAGETGPSPDCDIDAGPCIRSGRDGMIALEIGPRPVTAMRPLYFRVMLENHRRPRSVMVELSMPGMSMGSNRITLSTSGEGLYEGLGVIPLCPSGRRLWRAGIVIDGRVVEVFHFDVR